MPRSVIDIDINDERFRKFVDLYKQFEDRIKQMPAEWRAGADAVSEVNDELNKTPATIEAGISAASRMTSEYGLMTAALLAQNEVFHERSAALERANRQEQRTIQHRRTEQVEATKQEKERQKADSDHQEKTKQFWRDQATLTGDVARNAISIGKVFGGVAGGVLGAGSIAGLMEGIWGAAGSVGAQRTQGQGLGATAGEIKAFNTDFGRLGLDTGTIGSVSNLASTVGAWQFGSLGIPDYQNRDSANLTAEVIRRAKALWDQVGPSGHNATILQTTGLADMGINMQQWRTIGAQSQADIDRMTSNYERDAKSMNLPDSTQKNYQDLSTALTRLAGDFEASFLGMKDGASWLTRMVADLDEIVKNKGWTGLLTTDVPKSPATPDIPYKYTLPGMLGIPEKWVKDHPLPGGGTSSWLPDWLKPWLGGDDTSGGTPGGAPPARDSMLDAIMHVESGGNPNAVNRTTGAMGAYQFMPATWAQYGRGGSPFDPVAARDAASRYLDHLEEHYKGDEEKALAAYNWGEGHVDQDIAQNGPDWLAHAPAPTQQYVSDVEKSIRVDVHITNQTGANVAVAANAVRQ